MAPRRNAWLLALCAALLLPRGGAAEGEVCERPPAAARGPVSLLILASGSRVHELAASIARDASIVAQDASTIIFDDGRVLTADVSGASDHLNRLGWGNRPIQVVASFPASRARPRRARG
jgi:hypothetical protein